MPTVHCRCTGMKPRTPKSGASTSGALSPSRPEPLLCPCKKCKAKAKKQKSEPVYPSKSPEPEPAAEGEQPGQGPPKCYCAEAKAAGWTQAGQGLDPDYWPDRGNQGTNDDYWPRDDANRGRQPDYWPNRDDRSHPESRGATDNNNGDNDYWPRQQAYDDDPQDSGKNPASREYRRGSLNLKNENASVEPRDVDSWPKEATAAAAGATSRSSKEEADTVRFGNFEYDQKSILSEGTPLYDEGSVVEPRSACSINYALGRFQDMNTGRDTLGLPIHLRGKKGLLNISGHMTCHHGAKCDEYCGPNTNCSRDCVASSKGGLGIPLCGSETLNAVVTFLLEMLGILVFFAICTFTFWITVCYYVIQLLVDLINADRNVHVAVGIMFTLLIIAYTITHLSHGTASCFQPNQNQIKPVRMKGGGSTSHGCAAGDSSTSAAESSVKRSLSSLIGRRKSSQTDAKAPAKTRSNCSSQKQSKATKQKYTDCQGRKIFQRSRRNAMLTEMKQPPTWILWLRETVHGLCGRS